MILPPLGRLAVAVTLPISMLLARGASAADVTPEAQLRAARDLFHEAEKDEDALRWADALDKLARVAQVKLTPGVLYHTALCEENLGHLLAAMRDYKAAASQARTENAADVLRLVDKRIVDSTGRIPHLVVFVEPSAPDAVVRLDGEAIPPGEPVAADPGAHTVETAAPGRSPSIVTVTLQEGEATSVKVTLDLVVAAPAATTPEAEDVRRTPLAGPEGESRKTRSLAFVETGAAVALAAGGVGAYFAAGGQRDRAVRDCAQVVSTRSDACDSEKNGVRAWDWVAIGAWAGAAAAGTLAVLSFERLHRSAAQSNRSAHLFVTPASAGIEGSF
jgi:hypothetical protein